MLEKLKKGGKKKMEGEEIKNDPNMKYAAVPENLGRKISFGSFKIEDIMKFFLFLVLFTGIAYAIHMLYLMLIFLPIAAWMAFKKTDGLDFFQYLKLRMKFNSTDTSLPLYLYFGDMLYNGKYYYMVLEVNGISYAFMSEEDRIGLLMKYEEFLNACDFPMQFVVHTEKLDYEPFLLTVVNDTPTARGYKDLIKKASEGLYIQRYFVVIGVSAYEIWGVKDIVKPKVAYEKLKDRVEVAGAGLLNIGLGYNVLKGEELLNIYREVM